MKLFTGRASPGIGTGLDGMETTLVDFDRGGGSCGGSSFADNGTGDLSPVDDFDRGGGSCGGSSFADAGNGDLSPVVLLCFLPVTPLLFVVG